MARIKAKVFDPIPDFEEGETYKITDAFAMITEKRGREAIRVGATNTKTGESAVSMLWMGDEVSPLSKLGAFMVVYGDETDVWKGKTFECVKWQEGDRIINDKTAASEVTKKSK